MYYEVYADSLWLLNFVMNLYLLILVDRSLLRTATRLRLLAGAAVGALFYLVRFLWNAPVWLKAPAGVAAGTLSMILIAFRPGNARAFCRILEKLGIYSFLIGGVILFLMGIIPVLRENLIGICGVLGSGAVGFLMITYLQTAWSARGRECVCQAALIRNGVCMRAEALIDSGNSLVEPISGKPVSVISTELFQSLWKEESVPFRAIPFHSIGRERGILPGYMLPELRVEIDGIEKCFHDVYVAVSGECGEGFRMILNPALMSAGGSADAQ